MSDLLTRRRLLGFLSIGFAGVGRGYEKSPLPYPGQLYRYADPTTENTVVRLTTPDYTTLLPSAGRNFISLKPRMLYCACDRAGGRFAPFDIDLHNGAMRQLAETEALSAGSLALDEQVKQLYFVNGGQLQRVAVSGKHEMRKPETIAENVAAFATGGRNEFFVLREGRLERLAEKEEKGDLMAEKVDTLYAARPNGRGCLFAREIANGGQEFWYAEIGGKPVLVARGPVREAYWSEDGRSVLFLRDVPVNGVSVAQIHEVSPEEGVERCLAATSQFGSFSPNENDSVFVGASRSKAQPNIVLMLRSPEREMTLCEHHAKNAGEARPSFSPDSKRVYFQSDRDGKSAIYSINVEQLIEAT